MSIFFGEKNYDDYDNNKNILLSYSWTSENADIFFVKK